MEWWQWVLTVLVLLAVLLGGFVALQSRRRRGGVVALRGSRGSGSLPGGTGSR